MSKLTAAEALRRYHVAETRLVEVEKLIGKLRGEAGTYSEEAVKARDELAALYLERDRLQAESFHVFTEARRLG